jgi:hypothetical protein
VQQLGLGFETPPEAIRLEILGPSEAAAFCVSDVSINPLFAESQQP